MKLENQRRSVFYVDLVDFLRLAQQLLRYRKEIANVATSIRFAQQSHNNCCAIDLARLPHTLRAADSDF
jgi:hypothetical protein